MPYVAHLEFFFVSSLIMENSIIFKSKGLFQPNCNCSLLSLNYTVQYQILAYTLLLHLPISTHKISILKHKWASVLACTTVDIFGTSKVAVKQSHSRKHFYHQRIPLYHPIWFPTTPLKAKLSLSRQVPGSSKIAEKIFMWGYWI